MIDMSVADLKVKGSEVAINRKWQFLIVDICMHVHTYKDFVLFAINYNLHANVNY